MQERKDFRLAIRSWGWGSNLHPYFLSLSACRRYRPPLPPIVSSVSKHCISQLPHCLLLRYAPSPWPPTIHEGGFLLCSNRTFSFCGYTFYWFVDLPQGAT